jgi:hypothetical protein
MRWRALAVATVVGVIVLTAASPALAKGPDQATISGPGLPHPIVVAGNGEPGSGEHLGKLSEDSGVFLAMFGNDATNNQALTTTAPSGPLGPKFQIAFRVPGGMTGPDTVRQDLYPFASGGPVTYTRSGQQSLGGLTQGGWYRGPAGFADVLSAIGVPKAAAAEPAVASTRPVAAPAHNGSDAVGHASGKSATFWIALFASVAAACIVGAATLARLRRRGVAGA